MSASTWHYMKDGQQHGPVAFHILQEFARSGHLQNEDFVWSEGMPQWVPARGVPGLMTQGGPTFGSGSRAPGSPVGTAVLPSRQRRKPGRPGPSGGAERASKTAIRMPGMVMFALILNVVATILVALVGRIYLAVGSALASGELQLLEENEPLRDDAFRLAMASYIQNLGWGHIAVAAAFILCGLSLPSGAKGARIFQFILSLGTAALLVVGMLQGDRAGEGILFQILALLVVLAPLGALMDPKVSLWFASKNLRGARPRARAR
jgi:hypothetical protein